MTDYLTVHATKQCPGCFGHNTLARAFIVQFPGTMPVDGAVRWWNYCNDCGCRWAR